MIFARFFHQSPALCLIPGGDKCMKSHAWEQRKFGEMANRRSEVSASGNLPRVEYEDIVSGTGTLNKDVFEKQSQKQGIVFHSGDVLYGKLRPYLQNWLLASFNGLAVGDFWVLEPQGLNSNYLYRIIQTKQFDEIANQSVGTKMPRADWKLVSKATFLNPASFNEQRLIGKFFKDIDSLLTLHQRKWVEFFYPTYFRKFSFLNFWEFFNNRITNAWEQRKLGELSDIIGGGTPSTGNSTYWDGNINWYSPAEISNQIFLSASQRKISELGYSSCSAKILPKGTVLFTSRAGIGKTAILAEEGCTNQGFQSIVPHTNELDSYFIFSRTSELKKYGEVVGAGSTFVEVSGKQMAAMTLMMPPSINEQKVIGSFFKRLDTLLTLHQRQSVSSDLLGASLHL